VSSGGERRGPGNPEGVPRSVGGGRVLGLVLAAGGSTRMGRPKQLAGLDGRPLLEHVLHALDDAPVDTVVVALGAHAAEVQARVDLGRALPVVVPDWALGMGHVLASALAAEQARGHLATVVLLGDQPLVSGRSVARLVDAWRRGAGPVVTAAYGGRAGHPKLFDHRLLPELLRLSGDAGARDLLAARPGWVHAVEVGDLGSDADVDVEADLQRVGRLLAAPTPAPAPRPGRAGPPSVMHDANAVGRHP
jgi:CTP:molybdopterin cytidylyltransferase MocA